ADGSPLGGPLPFDTTTDTLAQQLTSGWQKSAAALDVLGDQIVSDFIALQQFYRSGATLQSGQVANAETALSFAAYAYLWKWFIGRQYPPQHAWPLSRFAPAPVDAASYRCLDDEGGFYEP